MRNFNAHTDKIREEMLSEISISEIENLYSQIPRNIRIQNLNLGKPLSEAQLQSEIKKYASKNNTDYISFLGAGAYKRFIPASVAAISSRFEFNTAYTPYQPEISQGTLQIIYEYQSLICNLTNMDVSNASIYDAATSCAEAVLMAARITGRNKCFIAEGLNPEYLKVVKTYCEAADIEIIKSKENTKSSDLACILFQTPDFYGEIKELPARPDEKALIIGCCDIVSLALLEPPECDIITGDIQSLGNSLSFGGPYGGFLACKDKYKRQLPGRIVGMTKDADGQQAFTLTLQTREQHIRREKATSNICSNQALAALQATVYLTVMGKQGFKQAAYLSAKAAHTLAQKFKEMGIEIMNTNFFNEFCITIKNPDNVLKQLKERGILGGLKLSDDKILISTTELIRESDIEFYTDSLKSIIL